MKRCLLIAALLSIVCSGVLRGSDPPTTDDYGYGYGYGYNYERDYDYGYDDGTDSSTESVNYFVGVLPEESDEASDTPAASDDEITLFSEEAVGRDVSGYAYDGIWIDEESDLDLYYGVTRDPVTGELVPLGDGAPVGADLDIWQTGAPVESTEPATSDENTPSETPADSNDLGVELDDLYETIESPEQARQSYCYGPFEYQDVEDYYGPYASYYYAPAGVETDESAPADATTDDSTDESDSAVAGDNQNDTAAADMSNDSTENTMDPSADPANDSYGEYGRYDDYDYNEYDDDYYHEEYSGYEDEYNESFDENRYDPNNEYGDYGPNGVTPTTDATTGNDNAAETDATTETDTTDEYTDEYDDGYGGEYGSYDEYGEYDPYGGYEKYHGYEATTEDAAPAPADQNDNNPTDTEKTNAAGDAGKPQTTGGTNDTSMYYVDKYHYYMGMQYDGRVDTPCLEYEAYRYADDVYNVESAGEPADKRPSLESEPPAFEEHPVIKSEEVDPSQLDLPYTVPDMSAAPAQAPIPVPHLLRVIYRVIERAEPLGAFGRIDWDNSRLTRLGGNAWK